MFESRFQSFDVQSDRAQAKPRLAALRAELKREKLDGFWNEFRVQGVALLCVNQIHREGFVAIGGAGQGNQEPSGYAASSRPGRTFNCHSARF